MKRVFVAIINLYGLLGFSIYTMAIVSVAGFAITTQTIPLAAQSKIINVRVNFNILNKFVRWLNKILKTHKADIFPLIYKLFTPQKTYKKITKNA